MGTHIIKMPDIGEGIVEVELVAWRVQPGDTVAEDQILADVMTDKATVEIPSPVVGKVIALGGEAGQLMAVGSELIRLEVEGAGQASPDPVKAAPAPAPTPAAAAPSTPVRAEPVEAPPPATPKAARAEPVEAPAAPSPRQSLPAHEPQAYRADRPIASPAVRRRAWEMGLDLNLVKPSGPAGRVMHEDLDAHLAAHGPTAGLQAPPVAAPAVTTAANAPRRGDMRLARQGQEATKIIGLRRMIAQKMQESKRRIPHFTYVEEVDVTELEALRAQLNKRHEKTRGRLTVLPFLVRAMVQALAEFPQINARLDDEMGVVTRYGPVHLGVAAQTPSGLMVPVLRHAETHDLWSAAAEIARLAEAARSGRATRDELTGSTITLSSLGPLGGLVSTPVINHPEVAIVGVNRIIERPMFRQGHVVARQLMNLSSSFDHRVVDGQDAAEFIQRIRSLLEQPALLFID